MFIPPAAQPGVLGRLRFLGFEDLAQPALESLVPGQLLFEHRRLAQPVEQRCDVGTDASRSGAC